MMQAVRETSDGHIWFSSPLLHSESNLLLKEFCAARNKPLVIAGLQYPRSFWTGETDSESDLSSTISSFLDNALQTHGKTSVVYISFGTVFFPTNVPWHLHVLIDALNEAKMPFILVKGSATSSAYDDKAQKVLDKKIAEGGVGMQTEWVHQESVLKHPA